MQKLRTWLLAATAASLCVTAASIAEAQTKKGKSAGDIIVRARAVAVVPDESGDIKTAAGADTGLDVKAGNDAIPELDFSYFITDNIALELIAGTSKHKVSVAQNGASLGSARLLPPTLTAQYHFLPKSTISPYIGAGINYTVFYNEKAGAFSSIDYENSFGLAAQAGVDIFLTDNWLLNFDVKKIWLDTKVSVNGGALRSNVELNPWLFGVGIGYRF